MCNKDIDLKFIKHLFTLFKHLHTKIFWHIYFWEYLEIYIYKWLCGYSKLCFSSTFCPIFGPSSPPLLLMPVTFWHDFAPWLPLRILSPSWKLCSALNCQTGVSYSYIKYGNKETFRFFKTEAVKQIGITALRTESDSRCRGLNNRMRLKEPIDVVWGLSAEALCLNMWPNRLSWRFQIAAGRLFLTVGRFCWHC